MARRKDVGWYHMAATTEISGTLSPSDFKAKTYALRMALNEDGPLYCRAIVPAFARKEFVNGSYAPWYVAHVNPDLVSDEVFAGFAKAFSDQQGYLFHSTDGLDAFMQFLEREHGYIVLFTYHDGYCALDIAEENVDADEDLSRSI